MRSLLAIVVLTYFTGCQRLPDAAPERAQEAPRAMADATAEIYDIDPERSELTMLIYRAGPLANLGHNHVISASALGGQVYIRPRLEDSGFELRFPVSSLVVDDPADRATAGTEFSSVPSATDIEGTRENMLGADLLDAANYPEVVVTGSLVESTATPELTLTIRIKDTTATRTVPVSLTLQEDELTVSGDFEMSHEELGLTPFSVMMGALRVSEEIRFRFRVIARRLAAGAS